MAQPKLSQGMGISGDWEMSGRSPSTQGAALSASQLAWGLSDLPPKYWIPIGLVWKRSSGLGREMEPHKMDLGSLCATSRGLTWQ